MYINENAAQIKEPGWKLSKMFTTVHAFLKGGEGIVFYGYV
jgi:hypothetical protein